MTGCVCCVEDFVYCRCAMNFILKSGFNILKEMRLFLKPQFVLLSYTESKSGAGAQSTLVLFKLL
jgi:hypothetical protein